MPKGAGGRGQGRKASTQKQARFFGFIAGGGKPRKGGPSRSQARDMLRGTKVKKLPKKARRRKKK